MTTHRRFQIATGAVACIMLSALLAAPSLAQTQGRSLLTETLGDRTRAVDVVIALDTSGSMDNLLDSVRARIWDVVNELGRMQPTPDLRVGLLSFGTNKATEEEGFIIQHLDLSSDLDRVYAEVMGLTIGGSTELVGRVVNVALDEMSWSREFDALRIVFLAGNESADQGREENDFRIAVAAAGDADIIVNALFAGSREQGIADHWHTVAQEGRGNFSVIDAAKGFIQIASPQDAVLLELNALLNETYVPFGDQGSVGLANQVAQDSNASRLGVQSCSSRIVAKGSALYDNASWDLVDKALEEDFDWGTLHRDSLPEALRVMNPQERDEYIQAKRTLREHIQAQIQEASDAREEFVQRAMTELTGNSGLGAAMRKTIREQAMAKGFKCDGC